MITETKNTLEGADSILANKWKSPKHKSKMKKKLMRIA